MEKSRTFGLSAALATPFTSRLDIDLELYLEHARFCLDHGCDSVTAMGTTGEAASLGQRDRDSVLKVLGDAGITGARLVIGIAATDMQGAQAQIQQAIDVGAGHILLPPPFFFKGVSTEGVYAWYSELMRAVGTNLPPTILYHLPSQTAVDISVELVSQLRAEFGPVIAGVKDSGGQWQHTEQLLKSHSDIAILVGDERQLAPALREGAQGAICGIANLYPEKMRTIVDTARDDLFINALVDKLVSYPIVPALKNVMAQNTQNKQWLNVRPPLLPLNEQLSCDAQ